MRPSEYNFLRMADANSFADPMLTWMFIGQAAIVIFAVTIASKMTNGSKSGNAKITLLTGLIALCVTSFAAATIWKSYTESSPAYSSIEEKIETNIYEKYDVASAHVDLPNTDKRYVIDRKTGDYISKVWVTRTDTGVAVTDVYDVVIDGTSGEPELRREFPEDETTPDPFGFMKK